MRETTTIIDSVNTETIAAQRILHNANGRVIQLSRQHFVQFTGHRIHFAETVAPADNLSAQHTTIIKHIVVQVTQERKSLSQQAVFVTHESQVFAIAQLHIPTYCAGNEIHYERKPVRRVVKQRSERRALRRIRQRHAGTCERGREHACVHSVHRADDHHEKQA